MALLVVGVLLTFVALAGVLPTRLKVGENEVQWAETVRHIEVQALEVGSKLLGAGVTDERVAVGSIGVDVAKDPTLARTAASLTSDVEQVRTAAGPDTIPPSAFLQLARWNATQRNWEEAARYYDQYVDHDPSNWQVQFARGTVHANSHKGYASNLAALEAYDAAIALRPETLPPNTLSRMFTYRGAIKKRLGRLDEAEADVGLGMQLASEPLEQVDAIYNLASIKALKGNRDEAIHYTRRLVELAGPGPVLGHLDDYFKSLRDDAEFKELIRSRPTK